MQDEDDLVDEIGEVLVVDAPDVADPGVSLLVLGLFAQEGGDGAVDHRLSDPQLSHFIKKILKQPSVYKEITKCNQLK